MYTYIFTIEWDKNPRVHTCDPSTGEAEAGGSGIAGQPGLPSKNLSQKKGKKAS
jgi:hypothetical protein